MTNIHNTVAITFSFSSETLEGLLKNYVKKQSDIEIFIAVLGSISAQVKGIINYEFSRFLPFPNLSDTPHLTVIPPDNWGIVLEETLKLEGLRFLGFIHSHPSEISLRSKADTNYGLFLSSQYGTILMGIIGKNSSLRVYQVADNKISLINGTSKMFKIKTK